MNKIEIGAVAKPQGIKGELKIKLFADDFISVKGVTRVEIKGEIYKTESFKSVGGDEAILKVFGIDDRNFCEGLRGESVFADRGEIFLPEGKYFITDVIGCKLFLSSGKEIGEITEIIKSNTDYYRITTKEGNAVFPLISALNAEFDLAERKVTVDAKKFTEVVLYED